jgi:hypothetical protein
MMVSHEQYSESVRMSVASRSESTHHAYSLVNQPWFQLGCLVTTTFRTHGNIHIVAKSST